MIIMPKIVRKIKIISPSGVINPAFIDGAVKVLTGWGFDVEVGRYAREVHGRFAGAEAQRIVDLQEAINDEQLDVIWCSRGGYGLAQIIDKIDFSPLKTYPKWVIGFSDITILHNVLSNMGVASIHGIMAKHLTELADDVISVVNIKKILSGVLPVYELPSFPENRNGVAKGKLIGGNLSVLMGLRGSPYDLNFQDAILIIEDIGEKPYQIDRMIQNLRFSGVFAQLSGLIVGHFTDCEEDPLMPNIHEIILNAVEGYDFPVCFGFPSGHENENYPLILGRDVVLTITDTNSLLEFS